MAEELNNGANGTPNPEGAGGTPAPQNTLTFDEFLEDKANQSEFDRRVSKALETAKAKWEKSAEADKNKAVTDATAQLDADLTKALIQTELVKANVRDVEVVMPLLDASKVKRTEKGLEGLEDQIKTLKDTKAYLFAEAQPTGKPSGRTGLEHGESGGNADDAKIRRIMGLPPK